MTPIRLKMQAFGPYQGAVEIAFSGLRGKLFLITGSTGGGKTTILDAICFALFCRRSTKFLNCVNLIFSYLFTDK